MLLSRVIFAATSLALLLSTSVTHLHAQNWAQWRGPGFASVGEANDLPVEFGRKKNLKWRIEMPGPGGASPVVWNGNVFVISVVSVTNELKLFCFDMDGNEKWSQTLKGENQSIRMDSGNSASPSPFTDGEHVWATTTQGFLECFDMDGNPVWSVDLQDRYGEFQIQFGLTSTPILSDGVIYHQMIHGDMRERGGTSVGHVVALNAKSGEEIWHHVRKTDGISENRHSYASPVLAPHGEGHCLVTHGGDFVIGHSLKDGKELWRCGGLNPKDKYNRFLRFVSSPTFVNGKLLVPSAKSGPVLCLRPDDLSGDVTNQEAARMWTLDRGTPDVASPVLYEGLIYLARENGAMLCLDEATGETVYMKRMFDDRHRSTPVIADGKIYIAGRKGTVIVLEPGKEGKVLAENVLREQITASPAVVNGHLFVRTWKALYCFVDETPAAAE